MCIILVFRFNQQLRSHHYVRVLFVGRSFTSIPEVLLVEEVHNDTTNGNYLSFYLISLNVLPLAKKTFKDTDNKYLMKVQWSSGQVEIFYSCVCKIFQTQSFFFKFQGQFCLAFLHSCQLFFYDCDYPKFSMIFVLPNAIFFYLLFADYYNKSYTPDERPGDKPKSKLTDKQIQSGKVPNGKSKHN